MYPRFFGNIEAKVDAKGRAFLPASFRRSLLEGSDEGVVVMRLDIFEQLLVIYPPTVWDGLIADMRSRLSRWDRHQQRVYRTFVSSAATLPVDTNGRILIPRQFLEHAGIQQQLRFVGMGDTIEVWPNDPEREQPLMDGGQLADAIEGLMAGRDGNDAP